jgi:predicted GNAT family acetyltransferase
MATAEQEDVRIDHEPSRQRYELYLNEILVGVADYDLRGELIDLFSVRIDPAYERRGFGGRLTAAALDDARARGLSVRPSCPFVADYIMQNQEYADLVSGARPTGD